MKGSARRTILKQDQDNLKLPIHNAILHVLTKIKNQHLISLFFLKKYEN